MIGILLLLGVALGLGAVFTVALLVAVRKGQFDDLDDPPERMLRD